MFNRENLSKLNNYKAKTLNKLESQPKIGKIHINKENVRVVVRIRPSINESESNLHCIDVDKDSDVKILTLNDPRHRGIPKKYKFDDIYDSDSTTEDIYNKEINGTISLLLRDCICINVFTFGGSGTGKTYTMHGVNKMDGLCSMTIKDLINENNKLAYPGSFSFSFFEVYCEKIKDLLAITNENGNKQGNNENVAIRTDICGRIKVVGVITQEFNTWEEFCEPYRAALKKRIFGSTAVNNISSRSHACIQINYIPTIVEEEKIEICEAVDTLENRRKRGSISFHEKPKISKRMPRTIVNLIDLSGFENNRITQNSGTRLTESTFINSSILALSKVINALKKVDNKNYNQNSIPYRESKLTRLLQEYLGGGAGPPYSPHCLRCVMICTVSPSVSHFQQTYTTLSTPCNSITSMKGYIGISNSCNIARTKVQDKSKPKTLRSADLSITSTTPKKGNLKISYSNVQSVVAQLIKSGSTTNTIPKKMINNTKSTIGNTKKKTDKVRVKESNTSLSHSRQSSQNSTLYKDNDLCDSTRSGSAPHASFNQYYNLYSSTENTQSNTIDSNINKSHKIRLHASENNINTSNIANTSNNSTTGTLITKNSSYALLKNRPITRSLTKLST